MRQKTVLLAGILALVAAPAGTAEESGTSKPAAGPAEEKSDAPAAGYKVDYKELFGCEPMGEGGHMPGAKPASGASRQQAMQPVQEHKYEQEQR